MAVSLPQTHYPKVDMIDNFYRQSLDFIHGLPNVEDAAVTNTLPTGHHSTNIFAFESSNDSHFAGYYVVSPTYFHTMQIPIKNGRPFAQEDSRGAPLVVIVNESFVKHFLKNEEPLHKRIKLTPANQDGPFREIVGIAGDTRDFGLDKPPVPAVFLPLQQDLPHATDMNMVVRTGPGHFEATISAIKNEIKNLDKDEPVFDIMPMEQVLQSTLHQDWVVMVLLMAFAATSLLLAAVGIFGLMAYLVSQRTTEIGVRMALGSDRTTIVYFILKRSTKLVLVGLLAGLVISAVLGKILIASFSTIHPLDPIAWLGSALTMLIVALVASYLPARKAANLNPAVALRAE
jgi:predicted permease